MKIDRVTEPGEGKAPTRKPSSAWRSAWRIAVWLGLGIGAAIVVLVLLLTHKSEAPAVQVDPAAGRQLEAQLRQAEAAAFHSAPQILKIGEGELNAIVDSHVVSGRGAAAQGPRAILGDMKIKLIDDRLHVYAVLNAYGEDMTVDLEGKVYTQNGYICFDPVSGRIGALPIPRSTLESAVREIVSSPENREDLRLPSYVKDLRVEAGKIVLTYR
jgi:hypothetical protein